MPVEQITRRAIPIQPFAPASVFREADPPSLRVIGYAGGENLLLRHSHCEKNQRSLVLDDEPHTPLGFTHEIYESHRQRVNHEIEARIIFYQHRAHAAAVGPIIAILKRSSAARATS